MSFLETRYLYMAYGMNTNRRAMEARCPLAKPMGGFYLPNYRLVFRGVADIVPEDGGVVPVVLWSITGKCLQALDRLEGYPHLYTRRKINHGWLTYMMQSKSEIAKPNHNYYRMIEEGYKDFGLDDGALAQASDDAGGSYYRSRHFRDVRVDSRYGKPSKFKSDWIADAMQSGKMNRAEAEDCWNQQEYRDS